MPRDERLYMTFPNDFPWHPKVSRLDPAVKWAFVEMNGYSRMNDLDGVIPAADAEFMWDAALLEALVRSHPTRPLVVRDGENYVIRDYAEHQQTKAAREELTAKRAEAGRKGGLAKSQASASKRQADGGKEKQSQSQSPEGLTLTTESSHVVDASVSTDSVLPPAVKALAAAAGITRIEAIVEAIEQHTRRRVAPEQAVAVARHLLSKVKGEPRAPQRYVLRAISLSPAEVQQYIDEGGLAA